MTREELEDSVRKIRVEMDRDREERNYFQLERDKLSAFWEVTRRQLDERKSELRNKDREMEELEERHQVEIKVYKQKVKHLLYEHQHNVTELKTEALSAVKQEQVRCVVWRCALLVCAIVVVWLCVVLGCASLVVGVVRL